MATVVKHGAEPTRQRTLLAQMVDQIASTNPSAVYGMWPVVPTSYEAGFRPITYAQLANIVNGLAWWLAEKQRGQPKGSEVFAYVGPNDARVPALALAGVKTGYPLFLTSPRNSIEAHQSLFTSLGCKTLVTPSPIPPPARPILETISPRHFLIPSVDELLETTFPHYEYNKTLEEGLRDVVMIIHTSGSTGIPKPLIWTQETALKHQNASTYQVPNGVSSLESTYLGKRVMVTLPPFHGAGLGQTLLYAIPFGNVVIAPAAVAIVTAQGLVEALEHTPADIALLVPSVVAELSQNPTLLDYCAKHLELIVYIGGDLPQQVGDIVAAKIPLRCQWGASEVGMPPQLISQELNPRTDWKYVRFHPCAGMVFDQVAENLYELVIRRDQTLVSTQPTFTISGKQELKEYRTRDLFAPHPTIPDEWAWQARADDIVVFLNGEKTNPITMEQQVVASNPDLLSGALVIGTHRLQAALLLEPVAPVQAEAEQRALVERLWPSIEEANRAAPAHARVEKSLVFVTTPDRPLVRAGKGTLQRGVSIAQYEAEINALYENAEKAILGSEEDDGDDKDVTFNIHEILGDVDLTTQRIRDVVLKITDWPVLDDSGSFFELGMDSLQALRLTRALRRSLHRPDLGLSTVYQNPTASDLAKALSTAEHASSVANDGDMMESLLTTYRQRIHDIAIPEKTPPSGLQKTPVDIILTGSTGTLGSLILRDLVGRELVGHVFCLNRAPDGGRSVQAEKWVAGDHATTFETLEARVTFLQANLARPDLGVDQETYEMLRSRVGLVIHNAWPVNFNLTLSAFQPQLAGIVNLFSFAAATSQRARVLFISSVGAVAGKSAAGFNPIPESIIRSLDAAHSNGYSQSKLLSELLCDTVSQHLGIPVSIARVGQVAGPIGVKASIWNRSEWFPSLVASSLHLGCLPENLGPRFSEVDWIPSNLVAEAIVDLATANPPSLASIRNSEDSAYVFNLRNPNTTTWGALIPAIQNVSRRKLGKDLDIVTSQTWLERLEKSGERNVKDLAASVTSNPAIKLLEFYRHGLWANGPTVKPMSVENALKASDSLQNMSAVQPEWVREWVENWLL